MIITHKEASALIAAMDQEKNDVYISLDLGLSKVKIDLTDVALFPDGQKLTVDQLKKVIKKDTICFLIRDNEALQMALFSEETNNYYKLVPTGSWPTLEISGIRMHVTKRFSPKEDTEEKISFVKPCTGIVLDTCTGLGYTAIMAAKSASMVFTIERDENVIEIEKLNPYSQELFTSDKIKRLHGDSFEEVKKFKACYFDRIIHDPPRQALSTMLYSQEFYNELFRILKIGGILFHYTGDPGAKRGLDIRAGITKRLEISGFKDITRVNNGLACKKP